MDEAYDDIGYLDAGVVDVVLNSDFVSTLEGVWTQKTLEGVAKNGVAEVTDMRCFVWVDAGVFDEAEARATDIGVLVASDPAHGGGAVEADVEVARSGNFNAGDTFQFGQNGG